ncbi:MAG: hypothetical protein AB7P69_17140 [Candidatus Binatia bacterium]
MLTSKDHSRAAQSVQTLGGKLLELAHASWQTLKEHPEVTQEVAKDPFTSDAKAQTTTAELLIFLLHACDRVATATFTSTLPTEISGVLRNALMGGIVGVTLPAFVRQACPEDAKDELEETQADLLHLYNARATQYSFFSLGGMKAAEQDGLFKLAGIRIAEALECPDNAAIIAHGVEVIMSSLVTLREQLPLKATIGEMMARTR